MPTCSCLEFIVPGLPFKMASWGDMKIKSIFIFSCSRNQSHQSLSWRNYDGLLTQTISAVRIWLSELSLLSLHSKQLAQKARSRASSDPRSRSYHIHRHTTARGKQTQLFHILFTEAGKGILEVPCMSKDSKQLQHNLGVTTTCLTLYVGTGWFNPSGHFQHPLISAILGAIVKSFDVVIINQYNPW